MDPSRPSEADLTAYRAGTLTPQRFEDVDRWVASLPDDEQARVLDADSASLGPIAGPTTALGSNTAFASDAGQGRYENVRELGRGGMGTVWLVHDRHLDREVALKRLRPRTPQESLEAYLLRLRAFRREAALTARLEHPAIVPVHDIGSSSHGAPAFLMKRLVGETLADVLEERFDHRLSATETAAILLRVAQAIAYAHGHGIVHRDLKPENIVVGDLGDVAVVDWGLAATIGAQPEDVRAGTPAYMAPEQGAGARADPRQDVYGLGALLMVALTGVPPRRDGTFDLRPLGQRVVAHGLAAVAKRCLQADPAQRYRDGSEVAAEIVRWSTSGLTEAQAPSPIRRVAATARQHPTFTSTAATIALAILLMGGWLTWHRHEHRKEFSARLGELRRDLPLDDRSALLAARSEVAEMTEHDPDFEEARLFAARVDTALETLDAAAARASVRARLGDLAACYRRHGPWPTEVSELRQALGHAGLELSHDSLDRDAALLASSPVHDELQAGLARLEAALLQAHVRDAAVTPIAELLQRAGSTRGWRALGALLAQPRFLAHDLAITDGPEVEAALAETATADQLLAAFAPDPRLVTYANARITDAPGDFWPRIVLARAAVRASQIEAAREHAYVALGAEPQSLLPHLVLAYAALAGDDMDRLATEVAAGERANPDHVEVAVLHAVVLARTGHIDQAQAIVNRLDPGHLQYHLHHPLGHPMERSVLALVDAGVTIPEAAPELGPLVPHQH
jgi:tRNA A-37 threonylcarbamoyl transferase component Bud32